MAHQAYPPQAYPPAPGAHPGAPPVGHGPPPFHPPPISPETLAMLQQFWTHADNDRSGSISSAELAGLPFPGRGPFGKF
ncbi:MAG: hypothetical protein Q8P67_12755 [archaeon]|nr:hypothetical protein [archaeon]